MQLHLILLIKFTNSALVTVPAGNLSAQLDADASEHAASRLISSEDLSSSSSEEEIRAKVLCGDGRVHGSCGVHFLGGGARSV